MHTGEAIVEDGDLFGWPVEVAARIANQASGGEILVSSVVREIVEGHGDFRLGDARVARLGGPDSHRLLHPVLGGATDA